MSFIRFYFLNKKTLKERVPLVVLDVGADLADDLGVSETVEVVVLDLKVLAHVEKDHLGLFELRRVLGLTGHDHCHRHRQVERVVRSLIM